MTDWACKNCVRLARKKLDAGRFILTEKAVAAKKAAVTADTVMKNRPASNLELESFFSLDGSFWKGRHKFNILTKKSYLLYFFGNSSLAYNYINSRFHKKIN